MVDASCSSTYNDRDEAIYSPNYPSGYGPNKHCTWKITAPEGRQLKLNAFEYKIEAHKKCSYDYLNIYDGPNSQSNRINQFCGTSRTAGMIESTGNVLFLKFKSDGDTHSTGFMIKFALKGTSCYMLKSIYYDLEIDQFYELIKYS